MAIYKAQRLYHLREVTRGSDGNLQLGNTIADGSGVTTGGQVHSATGQVTNLSGETIKNPLDASKTGNTFGQKMPKGSTDTVIKNTGAAQDLAKNNISSGEKMTQTLTSAKNTGFTQGKASAGIMDGMKNTWNAWGKQGTKGIAKKAGVIGGGILAAGLAAKGISSMMGGGEQKEFSDDTRADLREAALIGTGLTAVGGGVLLAKHGKLGFTKSQRNTSKEAYEKASKGLKAIFKEKEPKAEAGGAGASGGRVPQDLWEKLLKEFPGKKSGELKKIAKERGYIK